MLHVGKMMLEYHMEVLFEWSGTHQGFIHRLESYHLVVQHNKQYHMKVLLSSFYLNGHTLGLYSETYKIEPPCTA